MGDDLKNQVLKFQSELDEDEILDIKEEDEDYESDYISDPDFDEYEWEE